MTIEELEAQMRSCRKCASLFTERFVDPIEENERLMVKPIFAGAASAPVMLVGQAPGIKEYQRGKAFQGQAGGGIREIFSSLGVSASRFDSVVYQTSVTKCFPGRKKVRRQDRKTGEILFNEEDREPNTREIENCIPFLSAQISLIKPKILVLLGKLAIDGYLRLCGRRYNGNLREYVGKFETWNNIAVVFFPHTSGASRWLNEEGNRQLFREAQSLLGRELRIRKIVTQ